MFPRTCYCHLSLNVWSWGHVMGEEEEPALCWGIWGGGAVGSTRRGGARRRWWWWWWGRGQKEYLDTEREYWAMRSYERQYARCWNTILFVLECPLLLLFLFQRAIIAHALSIFPAESRLVLESSGVFFICQWIGEDAVEPSEFGCLTLLTWEICGAMNAFCERRFGDR